MSRKMVISSMSAVIAVMLAAAPAHAKGHKKGHEAKPTTTASGDRARPRDEVVFDRDGHRRIVTEYYSREGLPPGLAKRDSLPPGLAKQLRERGRLPPGLQKRLTPVPAPLDGRLQRLPPYYSRYFAGRDLVIVDRRTNTVAAIIPGARPR